MAFRGYFAINGVELANSSRVVAHIGSDVPTRDIGVFEAPAADCGLVESSYGPGTYEIAPSMVQVSPGMYTPPDGARRFGPGLLEVGDTCWGPSTLCTDDCRSMVDYDDSWPGLREFLGHTVYRPELAPWYVSEQPESAEFAGVWVMSCTGLDVTPVSREVQPVVGPGAVAGMSRDPHRTVQFEAVLIACTHAGLNYGLQWLACNLREATVDTTATLTYLAAHPSHSAIDPNSLVREAAGVVYTRELTIAQEYVTGSKRNQQATMYRVTWDMAVLSPYAYVPAVDLAVDWHDIVRQPINWIHSADCAAPENCVDMPVMFSTECVPEELTVVNTPPPVCGGCLPVGEISKYLFRVPTMDYPFRCRETAVTQVVRNVGEHSLSLQAFWQVCGTDIRCEDSRFPLQISGLPPGAELHLDGITGRYKAWYDGYWRRPIGVVGTPNGAPWRPPLIDRQTCWEFVVQSATTADFEVELSLRDREA